MPTTRKQKKARKSRGLEMLSDIENLDIMLGENHFDRNERNESVNSNQAGRPESLFGDEFGDENENGFPNPGNNGPCPNTELGHNSIRECSSVEINRLSSELNSRISREMDEMMNSVSFQIQRALNEAISSQILPQIQNVVMAGSGQLTKERWNVPAERPEGYSEILQNLEPRNNSKSKQTNDRPKDGFTSMNSRAHDSKQSIVKQIISAGVTQNVLSLELLRFCSVAYHMLGLVARITKYKNISEKNMLVS